MNIPGQRRMFCLLWRRLLFFPVDNSRSTATARQGLARLRKILDQLALEAAEAGNDDWTGWNLLLFRGVMEI